VAVQPDRIGSARSVAVGQVLAAHSAQGVRTATAPSNPGALRICFPDRAPLVTVHDASSHTMAWLGSALGVPAVSLGVDTFGQSGTVPDLYAAQDLDAGSIVNGALASLSLSP